MEGLTVRRVQFIAGIVAAAALLAAVNMIVLFEDLFVWYVVGPLLLGVLAGAAWLVLTLASLSGGTERARTLSGAGAVIGTMLFLAICVVVYAFAVRWDRSWDLTEEGRQELSPQTVQVLENLSEEVKVYGLFMDTGDMLVDNAERKTRLFLKRCQYHTPLLKVEFFDPQAELTRVQAMNLTAVHPQGTVVIEAGNDRRPIPLTGINPRLSEAEFVNALINVVRKTRPKVGWLAGHGERDVTAQTSGDRSAVVFREILQREAYDIQVVTIPLDDPKIPPLDLLVVNDPQSDFDARELDALQDYLDRGGRLLLFMDCKYSPDPNAPRPRLLSWLEQRYGVVVGEDCLISKVNPRLGELVLLPKVSLAEFFQDSKIDPRGFPGCFNADHPVTRAFTQRLILATARSVRLSQQMPPRVTGAPLLRTLPYVWPERDLAELVTGDASPVQDADEPQDSYSLAVAVTASNRDSGGGDGTPDARIIVVGESDLTSDAELATAGPLNFVSNCLAWLSQQVELIAMRPQGEQEQPIILSTGEQRMVKWGSTLGVLQVVVILGGAVYAVRRKYR